MSLYADDAFLDLIVHQARVAYATQQLNAYRNELACWQTHETRAVDALEPRVRHEMLYYTQQVARWQDYLIGLEQGINAVGSVPALDVPMSG